MSKGAQTKLIYSKFLPHPNPYVKAMYNEYRSWVLNEEDCLQFKGQWRERVFGCTGSEKKLDLEIGPGSGEFFFHTAVNNKDRLFTAIELKYKPLIQTTRKIKNNSCLNAKTIRYNARMLENIFAPEELNNVYIHFPDPWPKKRHHKHRLITTDFVKTLYHLMQKTSFVEVKTDHQMYFRDIHDIFKDSAYREQEFYNDLHNNKHSNTTNFITPFERIFIRKNQPVYYLKCVK